jgi:2,3-bisphosphoglycerate-independent phosphoglycerate mutase
VLEALGVDFHLQKGDVPARINFCTIDGNGNITDRRAGRIPSEEGSRIIDKLAAKISVKGVETHLRHVKEYRAAVVFRGDGLGGEIHDTDPQVTGKPTLPPVPKRETPENKKTAAILTEFQRKPKRS